MNRIRDFSKQNNIKISQVIKQANISKSFLYDIMNNKSDPTLKNARKIASALQATVDEIFPYETEDQQVNKGA